MLNTFFTNVILDKYLSQFLLFWISNNPRVLALSNLWLYQLKSDFRLETTQHDRPLIPSSNGICHNGTLGNYE